MAAIVRDIYLIKVRAWFTLRGLSWAHDGPATLLLYKL